MCGARTYDVILVGVGGVGLALVDQIRQLGGARQTLAGGTLRLAGLVDQGGALYNEGGLSSQQIDAAVAAKRRGESIASIASASEGQPDLREFIHPRTLFVDATGADGMGPTWLAILGQGGSVVLANKRPLCEPWETTGPLFREPRLRYEATVGAGLPILSTLRGLLATGDVVTRIEGALSGTLGLLAERMAEGVAFSTALEEAIRLGLAEPDPSDDVTGRDVARKLVILARSAAWAMDVGHVAIEGLVAPTVDVKRAGAAAALDVSFEQRFLAARRKGKVLRALASVTPNRAAVALTEMSAACPFATISGEESRVAIYTDRYAVHPLAVSGPGAGLAVTAAGILGDLLDLARESVHEGGTTCGGS